MNSKTGGVQSFVMETRFCVHEYADIYETIRSIFNNRNNIQVKYYTCIAMEGHRESFYNCILSKASSPACTELETIVMNWLGKMIGLPEEFLHRSGGSGGGGVIQTTASEATLVCLLAARTRAIRDVQQNEPDRLPAEINSRLVAYCSDQVRISTLDTFFLSNLFPGAF